MSGLSQHLSGLPQKVLGSYGSFMGRFPCSICAVSMCAMVFCGLGWIKIGPGGRDAMTTLSFEEQWTMKGTELEEQVKYMQNTWHNGNKDPWYQKFQYTLMLGKGQHTDEDLLTKQMIGEAFQLYTQFFDIKVKTASGREYTTWDLCARGAKPDDPAFPFKLPCKTVEVFSCFSEYAQVLDPLYAAYLDPHASAVIPNGMSYSNDERRPSFNNLSDADIKETVSQKSAVTGNHGCPWFVESATWQWRMFSGATAEWRHGKDDPLGDGDVISKARGLAMILYMDGPKRIAFRMSLTSPEKSNEAEIEEALVLHSGEWAKKVDAFNAKSTLLESVNLKTSYLEDLENDLEKPKWPEYIWGAVLMTLFIAAATLSWTSPLTSRCSLGQNGLLVALSATIATGGLFLWVGYRLNSAIVGGALFLAMGLGVNDMLVLSRCFSELGVPFIKEHTYSQILSEVMKGSGMGVTLTSLCNVTAFGIAALSPGMPVGLCHFCICIVFDSTANYIAMMTLFLSCLCLEAHRIKNGQIDITPYTVICQLKLLKSGWNANSPLTESMCVGDKFAYFLQKKVAPFFAKRSVGILLTFLACLSMGLSFIPITQMKIGYDPSELAVDGSSNSRALAWIFDEFTFFSHRLVFRDLDIPANQVEMLKLFRDVSSTRFTTEHSLPPYLTMFYSYVAGAQAAGVNKLFGVDTLFDNTSLVSDPAIKSLAPYGTVKPEFFYAMWDSFTLFPLENASLALLPGGDSYQWADMVWTTEFAYVDEKIDMSFFMFFVSGAKNNEEFVECIEEVNTIVDASPLKGKAFVYGDIFTYWTSFLTVDKILWRTLGISSCAIFAITCLLLQSIPAALIVAVMSVMIVINMFGVCTAFLRFNTWLVFSLLAGVGLSIEFTAHVASSFILAPGTPEQRLAHMMKETYPAILLGAFSSFLGIVPLYFIDIPFLRMYFFWPFTVLIVVGVIDGLILLPGVLALLVHMGGLCRNESPKNGLSNSSGASPQTSSPASDRELPVVLGTDPANAASNGAKREAHV